MFLCIHTDDSGLDLHHGIPEREKKGRYKTQSYDKSHHAIRKRKSRDNTNTPQKASIRQRLRTDLRRSVEVTTVIQLVLGIPTFPLTTKDMLSNGHAFKICKSPCRDRGPKTDPSGVVIKIKKTRSLPLNRCSTKPPLLMLLNVV